MSTSDTKKSEAPAAAAVVTVRVLKHGVNAGGMILGKGAVVRLRSEDAAGLVQNGSAEALN